MTDDATPHLTPEELLAIQDQARALACALFSGIVKHHRPLGHCPDCVLANVSVGLLTTVAVVLDALALDNEQARCEWVRYLQEALDAARAERDPRITVRAAAARPAVPGVH